MININSKEQLWWVVASIIDLPVSFNSELHCFKRGAERQIHEIEKEVPSMRGKLEPVAVKVVISRCAAEEAQAFDAEQVEFLAKRTKP